MTVDWRKLLRSEPLYEKGLLYSLLTLWVSLGFSTALMEIFFGVSLYFWLVPKIFFKQHFEIARGLWFTLGAYVLLCTLSIFWSEAPMTSLRGILKVLKPALVFLMTAEVFQNQKNLRSFDLTFTCFYVVLLLDAFWQLAFLRDFIRQGSAHVSSSGLRISASFKTYGLFASYLICTLPYIGGLALSNPLKTFQLKRVGYLCLFGVGLVFFYLTRSRGAFLSFGAGVFLFLVWTRQYKKIILGLVLCAAFIAIMPKTMLIHEDVTGREQSLVERCYLWERALRVIKAKPLTGTGINTYTAVHGKYDKRKNWRVRDYYAHNGYLQLTAETGIPSLIFLLGFLGLVFISTSEKKLKTARTPLPLKFRINALQVSCFSFLVFTMTDTVFHNPIAVMVFWYLLGILYANRPSDTVATTATHKTERI